MDPSRRPRPRLRVATAVLVVVALGVASRTVLVDVPLVGKELGSVLWAAMFYLIVLLAAPRLPPAAAAAIAFGVATGTELLQLYKAPWIENLRSNRVGGLLLGNYFAWKDVAGYAIGTVITWAIDRKRLWASAGRPNASGS